MMNQSQADLKMSYHRPFNKRYIRPMPIREGKIKRHIARKTNYRNPFRGDLLYTKFSNARSDQTPGTWIFK